MKRFLNKFRKDEDGAVTVDWVVLTASVVILGLAVTAIIQAGSVNGVKNMFTKVDEEL